VIGRKIVVIGGSLGSLNALVSIAERLPARFAAAVFVVIHSARAPLSRLSELLANKTELPVHWAKNATLIENGHIYIAPPDRHLIVEMSLVA
jgi:two-component system chemotaxis response regulator CheB